MAISFELPMQVESRLREAVPDLDGVAKIAVALDLFRNERITQYELGQMLGLDRFETNAFLVNRNEFAQSLTFEDVESDRQTIETLLRDSAR